MAVFKNYEQTVIEALTRGTLPSDLIEKLNKEATLVDFESTGHGYYLTVKHKDLPKERIVCDKPSISGEANGLVTGFVVFLVDRELTIECFAYDEKLPENFRDLSVIVSI